MFQRVPASSGLPAACSGFQIEAFVLYLALRLVSASTEAAFQTEQAVATSTFVWLRQHVPFRL